MTSLPFGFTEPLHLDDPFPWRALVFAGVLVWLLWRFLRSRRRTERPADPPPAPPVIARSRIAEKIQAVRRRHRHSKDFRAGCHELAGLLREFFETKRKMPLSTLTVGEMTPRLGDTPVVRLFTLLADLQFSRRPPTESDFDGACDLALDVTGRTGGRQ